MGLGIHVVSTPLGVLVPGLSEIQLPSVYTMYIADRAHAITISSFLALGRDWWLFRLRFQLSPCVGGLWARNTQEKHIYAITSLSMGSFGSSGEWAGSFSSLWLIDAQSPILRIRPLLSELIRAIRENKALQLSYHFIDRARLT
ncbi:uncharacterized protein MCYG_08052 [Microsporum canis CBS 113480]|uniref:Uncharacterized protein n=1 Tax=Arthroderma otae (strain ATCC MYA-4605 / CBS 113480) TaxID=554155 RepID=C5FZD0_ARTOC|nr:uncharacterized protein MCYG_08052 [Microsporum canis CBS 113480]EEQ35233.1 predicted protein [Microsporum canis CBS 113480]